MSGPILNIQVPTFSRRVLSLAARACPTRTAGDDLPLSHKLAAMYLMAPLVIWLVTWFHWWLGVPVVVFIIFAFRPILSGSFQFSLPRPVTLTVIVVSAIWVMSTAAGGFSDIDNLDWNKHRSIFLNLAIYPWPVFIPDPLASYSPPEFDSPFLLRYYLGWYIVPGAIARLLGPAALNLAVPLWTWLGVALILLLFVRERRGWAAILSLLIFLFFSGMDFLRLILLEGFAQFAYHIEWAGLWGVQTQYSANMTSLMWTPQHFIPAGLYTLLILQHGTRPRFPGATAVLLSTALFWSPFVAIGLLPLIAALLWRNGLRPFLDWSNLALASVAAGLTAIYLSSGSLDHAQDWIWDKYEWSTLGRWAPTFYLTEFLLLTLLLCALRPSLLRTPFFVASVAALVVLPLYHFGDHNDLTMRASLPAILTLCYYCTETIIDRARTIFVGATLWWKRPCLAGIATILAIGSLTAVPELGRAASNVRAFRFDQNYHTIALNVAPNQMDQYATIVQNIPAPLFLLLNAGDFLVEDEPVLSASLRVFNEDTLASLAAVRRIIRTEKTPIFVAGRDYDDHWVRPWLLFIFSSPSEATLVRTFDDGRSIIFPIDHSGARYLFTSGLPATDIMDRYFEESSARVVGTAPSGRPITLHRPLSPRPPFEPSWPVPARFGDQVYVYGFDMPKSIRAGDQMTIRWYWRLLAPGEREYAFTNQLFADDGRRHGQLDDRVVAPGYWPIGTTGITTFDIDTNSNAPSGAYWLRVAVYGLFGKHGQAIPNLPVFDAQGNQVGDQLRLGPIKVHGRPPAPSSEGLLPSPTIPDNLLPATFTDQIDILGYDLEDHILTPGASFNLKLYWAPRGRPTQDYTVFVHLLDSEGQLRGQADSPPTSGKYPTSVWDAGESIADLHTLSIAPDLPAGEYRVAIGLYDPQTGQRLSVVDEDGSILTDHVTISGLIVEGD